jgi:hypothetical protein
MAATIGGGYIYVGHVQAHLDQRNRGAGHCVPPPKPRGPSPDRAFFMIARRRHTAGPPKSSMIMKRANPAVVLGS